MLSERFVIYVFGVLAQRGFGNETIVSLIWGWKFFVDGDWKSL